MGLGFTVGKNCDIIEDERSEIEENSRHNLRVKNSGCKSVIFFFS